MAEQQDAAQILEATWRALSTGDWERAASYLHEDFVQEWPQSGERVVGVRNAMEVNRNFPGGLPEMSFRRTLAGGDVAVLETQLRYADGTEWRGVSIAELRDGKIVKETDYFTQPFDAPQWRAQWVERI